MTTQRNATQRGRRMAGWAALVLAGTLVGGCFSSSPRGGVYQLQPVAPADGTRAKALMRPVVVAIGPIETAPYLDRREPAWRKTPHEVVYDTSCRWAEPLSTSVESVLLRNVDMRIDPARVSTVHWRSGGRWDYRVAVEIERLEGTTEHEAVLRARWLVVRAGHETEGDWQAREWKRPAGGTGIEALLAQQSAMLGELADEIVGEVCRMEAP